ncbi:MAG: tetratricopeptide repeat protein, partial [Candidatus Scalindua sp.]
IASFKQAIMLNPDYADAHNNLGAVLKEQHKLDDAIKSFYHSIELNPDYADAHNNLGAVRQEQHKLDEAIVSYRHAISLKPDYAEAHNNLGTALKEQNKPDEAVSSYRHAISLKPDYAEAHYNLGGTFSEQGKLDEAMKCYKQAISLKPDYAEAHINLGNALLEQDKLDEAMKCYKQAISLKPDYAEAHFNKSLALLLTGNFEDGWAEYEWRLRKKDRTDCTSHIFQQPQWDGKPLNGRSILIQAEQGFGDTIQFVRYLPMVQANGGHVIFECQKNLIRLLRDCTGIDDIVELTSTSTPGAQSDFYALLLSLPGIFGTTLNTIPSNIPYITIDSRLKAQWKMQLIHDNDFKIGIVWAGNSENKKIYHKKSCTLNNFATISEIPGLSFYNLQKGPASVEVNHPPKGMKIINLGDELNDFADTAALIANLDMVISVDTAVAHLAGAIGKPVWTLIHSTPDWRWLLNRDDSPWYPGMRLFRQTQPNNWAEVFEQVKKALIQEIMDFRLRASDCG